jgi:hypothetical protein
MKTEIREKLNLDTPKENTPIDVLAHPCEKQAVRDRHDRRHTPRVTPSLRRLEPFMAKHFFGDG